MGGVNIDTELSKKLSELLELASRLHGSAPAHREFTLQSMKDHVDEIRMLVSQGDEHWKDETTDLFIHCLLILQGSGLNDDDLERLLARRLERFREKITDALRDKEHKAKFRADVYGKKNNGH